jgi:molybdopterin converting factor small subunit
MNITVRLGEPLWRKVNTKEINLELPTGAVVADSLTSLGQQYPAIDTFLNRAEVPPTIFLNNELAAANTPLVEGAQLMLIWAVAGG